MLRKAGHYAFIVAVGIVVFVTFAHVQLKYFGETLLAEVGVVAGVAPNPYNSLNEQLDEKAAELNSEQAYLNREQAALTSSTVTAVADSFSSDPALWDLTVAVLALIVLVFLNFYFDWRRGKKEEQELVAARASGSQQSPPPPAPPDIPSSPADNGARE